MEAWKQSLLSGPYIEADGVRVPSGAIKRVIGPIESAESCRIRAARYSRNAGRELAYISLATDDEITDAMTKQTQPEVWAATGDLQKKYPGFAKK